jgi:hypothetical protein
MTGNASTVGPGSRPESRAQTMPGQRLVNLVVRALLRTGIPTWVVVHLRRLVAKAVGAKWERRSRKRPVRRGRIRYAKAHESGQNGTR